jgi:alpha-tubulin suppressor-like RCC1 family protein
MSQEKAQLIAPLGVMAVDGITATGVITASSFSGNVVGSAKSLVNGSNVSVGVITATSFAGNLTGNILRLADSAPNIVAGVSTATSFVGNLTGSVTDLTSAPAITVGMVTATTLEGPVTGNVTGNVSGLAGGLGVNYNGGWPGAGTSQINAGVVTATFFHGDGSNLEGVSSGPVSQQSIGITSATTSIDLSNGNLIHATQSANTTVSFASTANGNVYFIRTKDDTTTARTITWPASISWDGGTEPTLSNSPSDTEAQVFLLVTRNEGVAWYGKEIFNFMGSGKDLFTWGYDTYGAGGTNSRPERSSPAQVGSSDSGWNYVYQNDIGSLTNYYSKLDGSLWSAGYNSDGNLGVNDRTTRSSPVQVGTDTTWSTGGVIGRFTPKFLKTDGTLWAWGRNHHGQLGLNQTDTLKLSSPAQIPGTTWSSFAGIGYRTLALKTDGTFWSWGYNEYGQTGSNDRVYRSSPTQVGTETTWAKLPVSGGENASAASALIKTDGTMWIWGMNHFSGKLGLNQYGATGGQRSSPAQLPGTTWSNIACGQKTTMATKTDGTLWMMGYNDVGNLGLNDVVFRSSPTQIPGTNWHLTNFRTMTNSEGALAMKQDGTLWAWGNSTSGQFGLNSNTKLSSPTQVTGTWHSIGGGQAISALKA